MSNKGVKIPKPRKPIQVAKRSNPRLGPLKSAWGLVLGIATLIGVPVALLIFLPRPSVSLSDPVDPNDPWSSTISISNANFIPLNDAGLSFAVGQMAFGDRNAMPGLIPTFKSKLVFGPWQHHQIGMDDRYDVSLDDLWKFENTRFVDIGIIISYRPWILPLRRQKIFRFIPRKDLSGRIHWYAYPLDEAPPDAYLAN